MGNEMFLNVPGQLLVLFHDDIALISCVDIILARGNNAASPAN